MAYIGNAPITAAFLVDTFSGTGSQTAFTMTVAPANTSSIIVAVTGVLQDPSTYSVSGTTLTFSAAPPSGTSNISVRYLGIPASGVTTTAYRTVTNTTATAGQTSFTIPSYTVGYVDVYRNGVYLPTSDYTASTGTTVVLNNAATAGDTITTVSFYVSSVLNAIAGTGGSVSATYLDVGSQNGTGSVVIPTGTTAQRPSGTTVGQTRFNTSLSVPESYTANGWSQGGMYLTGSANIASGSSQNYIDIANCFNSTFQNYVVKFIIYNGASAAGSELLGMAYESTGASLSGGMFSGGTFPAGFYWVMRYLQTTNSASASTQGGSGSSTNYPEIFGTLSAAAAGQCYFSGTLNLYDVYASSVKTGDAQGTMVNPTVYLEQSNFYTTTAYTGRGIRFWIGNTNGYTINSYGVVKVYGML